MPSLGPGAWDLVKCFPSPVKRSRDMYRGEAGVRVLVSIAQLFGIKEIKEDVGTPQAKSYIRFTASH
jgi:hypothetical protein